LTISSVFCIPFISPSCLTSLAKNSKTMMKSRENGHLCTFPDFRGNCFSFPNLVCCWLLACHIYFFIMLRYIPSTHSFIRDFVMKKHWILLIFFSIYWDDNVAFLFASVNIVCITFNDFHMLDHPCISRI
jgi:hypothetical protein